MENIKGASPKVSIIFSTMKFAVFALVLAVALVAAEEKRCGSSGDCAQDECCMVRGIAGWRKGDCKKRAQQGEVCNQDSANVKTVHGDQYILFCPCAAGYQCEVTKVKELPIIGNVTVEQICTPNAA